MSTFIDLGARDMPGADRRICMVTPPAIVDFPHCCGIFRTTMARRAEAAGEPRAS